MSAAADVATLQASFGAKIWETLEFRGEQTVRVELSSIHDVLAKCRNDLGYEMILDVSSLDHFGDEPRFEMVYEIATLDDSKRLRIKAKVSEEETVPSVTDLWVGADWHEREVWDMMGIKFRNHPDLRRILMWEGYPYHPLRKDFPLEGIPTDVPDVAFTEVAPLAGGPFVTIPTEGNTEVREPRARHAGDLPTTATFIAEP